MELYKKQSMHLKIYNPFNINFLFSELPYLKQISKTGKGKGRNKKHIESEQFEI